MDLVQLIANNEVDEEIKAHIQMARKAFMRLKTILQSTAKNKIPKMLYLSGIAVW